MGISSFFSAISIKRTSFVTSSLLPWIPYFFCYKIEFFSFQNNPKNLDPTYKMDLNLRDCLGRVKLTLQQNFTALILLFVVILEGG